MAEIPVGRHTFKSISLGRDFEGDGLNSIQWDGTDLAVANNSFAIIDRFAINGSIGTKIGSTKLQGGGVPPGVFWIATVNGVRSLYTPFWENGFAGTYVYRYPKGGKATQRLYADLVPHAVTVSMP